MRKQQHRNKKDAPIVTRQGGIGERRLTAVVAVIQRPETTTPTATTERKRKAAVVLDSAALSTVRVRQSAAAVAMAAGRRGPDGHCSRPARLRESRRRGAQPMLSLVLGWKSGGRSALVSSLLLSYDVSSGFII